VQGGDRDRGERGGEKRNPWSCGYLRGCRCIPAREKKKNRGRIPHCEEKCNGGGLPVRRMSRGKQFWNKGGWSLTSAGGFERK